MARKKDNREQEKGEKALDSNGNEEAVEGFVIPSENEGQAGEASRDETAQPDEVSFSQPAQKAGTKKGPPVLRNTKKFPTRNFEVGTDANIERYRQELFQDLGRREDVASTKIDRAKELNELYEKEYELQNSAKNWPEETTGRKKLEEQLEKAAKDIKNYRTKFWNDHVKRRQATMLYEDFLYYQNPRHRRDFAENRKAIPETQKHAKSLGKTPPVKIPYDSLDKNLEPSLRGMRRYNVGTAGRLKDKAIHEELHMRTPNSRNERTGFGRPSRPLPIPPLSFEIDEDQVEKRRIEVDSRIENDTQGLEYKSHEERRVVQSTHPHLRIPHKILKRLTTKGGMFIAARERSDDWPTSYDYLDVVRCGAMARALTEKEDGGSEGASGTRDEGDEGSPGEIPDTGEDDSISGESSTGEEDLAAEDESDDKSDYSDFEFARSPRQPSTNWKYEETTPWAEATIGRREWHAYGMMSPSSTVCSPPRTPNEELDFESMPLELPKGKLMPHERETYHHRVQDQYGISEENWPRIAIRVPYDPDSYLEVSEQDSLSETSGEKVFISVHPLLQPVVDMGPGKYETLGFPPEPNSEDEKSDDEGDLFIFSYRECSRYSIGPDSSSEPVVDEDENLEVSVAGGPVVQRRDE